MFLWLSKSAVGIDCCASRQRKTLTFDGTSTWHILVQDFCPLIGSDEAPFPSSQSSLSLYILVVINKRYADLTEKNSFLFTTPCPKSSCCIVVMGMFRIVLATIGRKVWAILVRSNEVVVSYISSKTKCGSHVWDMHMAASMPPLVTNFGSRIRLSSHRQPFFLSSTASYMGRPFLAPRPGFLACVLFFYFGYVCSVFLGFSMYLFGRFS